MARLPGRGRRLLKRAGQRRNRLTEQKPISYGAEGHTIGGKPIVDTRTPRPQAEHLPSYKTDVRADRETNLRMDWIRNEEINVIDNPTKINRITADQQHVKQNLQAKLEQDAVADPTRDRQARDRKRFASARAAEEGLPDYNFGGPNQTRRDAIGPRHDNLRRKPKKTNWRKT